MSCVGMNSEDRGAAIDLAVEMLREENKRSGMINFTEETLAKLIRNLLNLTLLDAQDVAQRALQRYYWKHGVF